MKQRFSKLLISSLAMFALLLIIPSNAFAIAHSSGAHSSGGHASASHATASHSTASHSVASHSATHTDTATHTTGGSTHANSSENIARSVQANKTPAQSKVIAQASHTSTYASLHSVSQKQSYLNWHSNYSEVNNHNATNYFTSVNYFWMPGNIWHTAIVNNQNNDNLTSQMLTQAHKRNYKWIKVGSKMIAVPQHIYNKVHLGDSVKLIDNNTIEINGKLYK